MKRMSFGIMLVVFALTVLGSLLLSTPVYAQVKGTNWVGTFWNSTDLTGGPAASNIPYPDGIYYNWGGGPPRQADNTTVIPGVNSDMFSAQFTSSQTFATGGLYTFTVYADDGMRVYINGAVVLDQFGQNPTAAPRTFTFNYNVNTGQTLTFRLDYVEYSGDAIVGFQWGLGTGGNPTGPTVTSVPPALGTVFTVRGLSLRTGPYLGASMVGVVRPNNNFPILEQNFDEGLFPWYKIQDQLGRIGWVSGRYLRVTGNIQLVPTTTTHFDNIDNPNDLPPLLNVVGYTRSVMNFRRRPSERTNLLGQIPWGDPVEVIGRTVQGGQNFWLQVRYKGVVGWIYAPFVKLEGVVDAVPIR